MSLPKDNDLKVCLEKFGRTSFLPLQEEAVRLIQNGHDTLTILPPGSGKSLIFQISAMLRIPKLTVVISPLIVLMDDQVRKVNGLRAVQIHSGFDMEERIAILNKIERGKVDLVYISPEAISSSSILDCIAKREIGLLVIDEAHCVSLWGHNFRPSYLFINEIRKQLGNPQLALFTATAPPHVIEDVKKILEIDNIKVVMGEPFRDNIVFEIMQVSGAFNKLDAVLKIINDTKDGSIIIYATTIKEVLFIYKNISAKHEALMYHGKMSSDARRESHEFFIKGMVKIMVCTSAFGMGIDKSDIYTIIHFSIPGSLEAYIQESGRAGRDGKLSKAILLHSKQDYEVQYHFISQENPSCELIRWVYRNLREKSLRIEQYQGSPVSYAQAKYFVDRMAIEKTWLGVQINSTIGILIDFKLISFEGNVVKFPFGDDIVLNEDLLKLRKEIMFKQFQIMTYCAQNSDIGMIRRYFQTNIFNEIQVDKKFTDFGFAILLKLIRENSLTTTKLIAILRGEDKQMEDRWRYGDSFGIYEEVSSGYIRNLLGELVERCCLHLAQIGTANIYFISEIGEAYLVQKGIVSVCDDEVDFNIHHFASRNAIIRGLKDWQRRMDIGDNEIALFPKKYCELFVKSNIIIGEMKFSGEEILLQYTFGKSSSVTTFKQLALFFLNIREKKVPQGLLPGRRTRASYYHESCHRVAAG